MRWLLLIYMLIMSLAAFAVFGIDKFRAKTDRWRVRERTLFLLALLGGGVGAFLGMRVFRHKTRHTKFVIGIPAIMAVQLVVAVFLWTRLGNSGA